MTKHLEPIAADYAAGEKHDEPVALDGISTLRERYGVALRLWRAKGPKDVGGEISAVFLQDAEPPRVVMMHQLDNGKFTVWEKTVV